MSGLVSFVNSPYNAARCVCRAIDSVLMKIFQGFEFIVGDAGNVDYTAKVRASNGERIHPITRSNGVAIRE